MTWRSLVKNNWFLYGVSLPFFIPYSLKFIPSLTTIYSIISLWKLAAVLIIFFLYFSRLRVSKTIAFIIAIHIILIISSAMNGLTDTNVYTDLLPTLALPMLIDLSIRVEETKILQVLSHILSLLTLINFVLIVVYPTGLTFATLYTQTRNPLHFLGQDNGLVYTLLPLLGINYLLREYNAVRLSLRLHFGAYSKIIYPTLLIMNIISLLTVIIAGSATGLLVVIVFLTLTYFSNNFRMKHALWILVGFYMLFFLSVVLLGENSPIVSSVTSLLGRDQGFTGRSLLWENALSIINDNPLNGVGNNPEAIRIWGGMFSAHNQLLDLALRGGLTSLFLFICLHISVFKQLNQSQTKAAMIVFATIFGFLVGGLMESDVRLMHYGFLVLAGLPSLYHHNQHNVGVFYD